MDGHFKIQNIRGFDPFQVTYRDLTEETVEVDVCGRAVLREHQDQTERRLREMWVIYDELTEHSSNDIGFCYELRPRSLKKAKSKNRPGLEDAFVKLIVIYKKPFAESSEKFELTTELIVTNILDSIFVIPTD